MADYDTSVRVHTEMETKEVEKGAKKINDELEKVSKKSSKKKVAVSFDEKEAEAQIDAILERKKKEAEEAAKALKEIGKDDGNRAEGREVDFTAIAAERARINREIEKQAALQDKVSEKTQKDAAAAEKKAEAEAKAAQREAEKEAKIKEELEEQQQLESIRMNAVVSNQNLVDLLEKQARLEAVIVKLKKAGVTPGYRQYDEAVAELNRIKNEISSIRQGFTQTGEAAKGFHAALQSGARRTNGLLGMLVSRLKGIALSLFVFNWISKGFNAMVSSMKTGFHNLAQYSKDYNAAMSAMKSECAEVKNNLAAAFEPIVTRILPYITQLVQWLNRAIETMGKFLAAISGRSTYTRAKQQVIDYAKSVNAASKSAKGALATFDEINVLQKNEESGAAAGGEKTGADAFETVSLSEEDMLIWDKLKEKLTDILKLLLLIGLALAVLGVGGPVVSFLGVLLTVAGLLEMILNYMDTWANGVSFENLTGMLLGLLAVILGIYLLFGPVAAGIAMIVGGIALVVLAIKDMMENGVNMQNMFLLVIGVVTALVGVFMVFGIKAALVVGAIVAVIGILAAMIAIAGNGQEAIATLKSMFQNFADFFKKIFAGDIEGALESLKAAGKDFVNIVIITFESLINCIIKGLNWMIDKINAISFEVPDWVPVIGGKNVGFNIPHVSEVSIPRLATGGVINGPTRALVGEAGQEAVLPLENNTEWMDDLADKLASRMPQGSKGPVYLQIDGQTFAKLELPYLNKENRRIGVSFAE
ncbi:MAG: hypothetical protein NC541_15985 [bacterium]|nr:hypothetical protein [bacterium]